MKSFLLLPASLLAYISFAAAANSVKFINHCPYDIWYWPVGPAGSRMDGPDEARVKIPGNHGSVIHGMVNTEFFGGGIALKLRDYPKYQIAPAGIVQVEYHFESTKNKLWYDLSVINCDHASGPNHPSFCPLIGGGIKLYVTGAESGHCPPAWCSNGKCKNTYDRQGNWVGEPSFHCNTGVDIFVETCTDGVGPRTFQDLAPVEPPPYEPEPQWPLQVSPGGTCGGMTGYTCAGSRWGECCSRYGYCGSGPEYCEVSCQSDFGVCPSWDSPTSDYHPPSSEPTPSYDTPPYDTPSYAAPSHYTTSSPTSTSYWTSWIGYTDVPTATSATSYWTSWLGGTDVPTSTPSPTSYWTSWIGGSDVPTTTSAEISAWSSWIGNPTVETVTTTKTRTILKTLTPPAETVTITETARPTVTHHINPHRPTTTLTETTTQTVTAAQEQCTPAPQSSSVWKARRTAACGFCSILPFTA